MFGNTIILMLLLLWKQDTVNSVRLVGLRMPTHRPEGDMALLGCQYDMEGDTLYTLKWYKDEQEFYRFVPKNEPTKFLYFAKPGVHVDLARSSNTVVALVNLTQESEGYYRCEVSGEAPSFYTVSREKYIHIHLLPTSGPRADGLKDQYQLDEIVAANCTLPASRPEAHLKWLINDQPAPPEYVTGPWYRVSAERPDAKQTILQLKFQTTPTHFINGPMKLKCQATIAPLYQEEVESTHYVDPFMINESSQRDTAVDQSYTIASYSPSSQVITDQAAAASMENSIAALLLPIIFTLMN